MSTTKPCATANCECEDFLIPKSGNLRKCADVECSHPLGAHQTLIPSMQAKYREALEQQIISLDEDDEEKADIRILRRPESYSSLIATNQSTRVTAPSRSAIAVASQSRPNIGTSKISLSFKDEVNFARQKAITIDSQRALPEGSRFAPISLSRATIQTLKPMHIKTTIWTRQDGSHMVKENNTQWWEFPLDTVLEDYNTWLVERILSHTGWLERKGGKEIKMDRRAGRPILVGESESRGDATTLPIPNHGGTWREILSNIPQFLEDFASDDIPRGTKRSKTIPASKSKSLAIVIPTTVPSIHGRVVLAAGWSPKKQVGRVANKLLKGRTLKIKNDKLDKPLPTIQNESTTPISYKTEDPMSIAAILKTSEGDSEDRNPELRDVTIAESSAMGSYSNRDKAIIRTPPQALQRKNKGSKKRSTSFLSPDGLSIKRGDLGKRGKFSNLGKSRLYCIKTKNEPLRRKAKLEEDLKKASLSEERDDSGSGWDSESSAISDSERSSCNSKQSSIRSHESCTERKGKEVQY